MPAGSDIRAPAAGSVAVAELVPAAGPVAVAELVPAARPVAVSSAATSRPATARASQRAGRGATLGNVPLLTLSAHTRPFSADSARLLRNLSR
jgi:hypothetical protein